MRPNRLVKVWLTTIKVVSQMVNDDQRQSTIMSTRSTHINCHVIQSTHVNSCATWTNHILTLGSIKACQMVQSDAAMWSLYLPYFTIQSTTTSVATSLAVNCHVILLVNSYYHHVITIAAISVGYQKMQEIFQKFLKRHYNSTVTPKIEKKICVGKVSKRSFHTYQIYIKNRHKKKTKKNLCSFSLCFFSKKKKNN